MAKVLIIESDEGARYLYQIALKFQKFEVLTTNTAKEGLDLIKNQRPNLVLLDVMVPDLNQFDFLSGLKEGNTELPIIILTDLRDGAAAKEAAIFGACEYLNKNESLGEIITSIRKVVKE